MNRQTRGQGGLVYSTDGGRMCPACRHPAASCVCRPTARSQTDDGIVRVGRESKGRGGKTVTLVRGLALDDEALGALARRLRVACGTGGTVKDGVVEVQGDHAERIVQLLQGEGWCVKRAGG